MAKKPKAGYTIKDKDAKEEFRRLTQFANRRIAAAFKEYEKEGFRVVPADVTGGLSTRQDWYSDKYALSRSIKFANEKEYKKHLHWLRQFEHIRPTIGEYTDVQRTKTLDAIETTLGMDVPEQLAKTIAKASAPQLSRLWKEFNRKVVRQGFRYSSNDAMSAALLEIFPEDVTGMATSLEGKFKKAM
jgi:hypothetical protein